MGIRRILGIGLTAAFVALATTACSPGPENDDNNACRQYFREFMPKNQPTPCDYR